MDTNVSMHKFMCTYHVSGSGNAVVRGLHKITFPALEKKINRVAGGLYALGVRQGDVVMSALPNIEQSVVLLYAVSKLGGVLSPVHPLVSKEEFSREVKLQKPKVAVLSDINLFEYNGLVSGAKVVYCPYWMYAYFGLPFGRKFEEYKGNGELPALYLHSGGTSGVPKTVVISAYAANSLVSNLLSAIPYKFSEKDGMLVTLPMFHGFGLIVGIHVSLSSNMTAVLVPKFSGKKATKMIARTKATSMIAVPRMLKKMLDEDTFSGDTVKCLHNVYVGGDALEQKLIDAFNERMKECGSDAVVQQGYGLTEMGSVCVLSPKDGVKGSVGKAIDNVSLSIIDQNEDGVGELALSSPQMMSGYLNDDEATKATLVEIDGKTYLRTGDLFRKDGDNLFYSGRIKRLIKISGMNVFPAEIERVAGECGVGACAAIESSRDGKTCIRLVVEGTLSEEKKNEIIKTVSKRLSHWHIPQEIVCVDELPKTAIGKIDYLRLQNEHK